MSLIIMDVKHVFMYLMAIWLNFFIPKSISHFNCVDFLFIIGLYELFIYSGYESFDTDNFF